MTHCRALRGSAGCLLLLVLTTPAWADPVAWSYQWSSSPQIINSQSSSSAFVILPFSGPSPTTTGSQMVTGEFFSFSNASAGSPDTIPATSYSLALNLSDKSNGLSQTVTFPGQLSGQLWSGGASLSSVMTSTSQSVNIGGDVFQVTLKSFGPSTADGSAALTPITFEVDPPQTQKVPEPSTLLLLSFAAPLFLTRRRLSLTR